jgi:hypothetical protein
MYRCEPCQVNGAAGPPETPVKQEGQRRASDERCEWRERTRRPRRGRRRRSRLESAAASCAVAARPAVATGAVRAPNGSAGRDVRAAPRSGWHAAHVPATRERLELRVWARRAGEGARSPGSIRGVRRAPAAKPRVVVRPAIAEGAARARKTRDSDAPARGSSMPAECAPTLPDARLAPRGACFETCERARRGQRSRSLAKNP